MPDPHPGSGPTGPRYEPPPASSPSAKTYLAQPDGRWLEDSTALRQFRDALPADVTAALGTLNSTEEVLKVLGQHAGWSSTDRRVIEEREQVYADVSVYLDAIGRPVPSREVLTQCYHAVLMWQQRHSERMHKGHSLVKLSEAYRRAGWCSMADRYLMLTLVEDAMTGEGDPHRCGGVLWRLDAINGWPSDEAAKWFRKAFEHNNLYADHWSCPEAVLQDLPDDWQVALPTSEEVVAWQPNRVYCDLLIQSLGSGGADGGRTLERLASYLMACVPGARVKRRVLTRSTDLDVFCLIEGPLDDFRYDLGRQWICECKDTDKIDFSVIAKFARVLDASKCKSGVLFTRGHVSGWGEYKWAHQEICRLYQQHGIVILVIDIDDLRAAAKGRSFLSILRNRYEEVRHDLWKRLESR